MSVDLNELKRVEHFYFRVVYDVKADQYIASCDQIRGLEFRASDYRDALEGCQKIVRRIKYGEHREWMAPTSKILTGATAPPDPEKKFRKLGDW